MPGQALEAVAVPAGPGDGDAQARETVRDRRGGLDQGVHPFPGHEATDTYDEGAGRGQPQTCPGRGFVDGGQGPETSRVNAGRDLDSGRESAPFVATALAQGPAGLGLGIAAGRYDQRCVLDRPAQELLGNRQPPGHGHLGPVQDHAVGQAQRRPNEPEGQGRVDHHGLRPRPLGQLPDLVGEMGLGQQHGLARPDHSEGLLAVPPGRGRVGGGVNGDVVRRQPAPQLP